ncbi:unnamed protein product [Meganyctiphanes norvegica]|uniref:Ig-like domain-containing protein n=1 Tax=Meganyctiphanes norvegica TaxID=48144 RepID=A0AAV2RSB2_MEGNR
MLLLVLTSILPGLCWSLEVLGISGPGVILNGSMPLVVLDCDYEVAANDRSSLVVKWFHNRAPYPVYQWIPHSHPQDLGFLKGRVQLDYVVDDLWYKKHRALAIRNPTTDDTGEYTCWISTFESEAFKRKTLIIYSPVTDLSIRWSRPRVGRLLVKCNAGGVYPEPEVLIIKTGAAPGHSTLRRQVLDGVSKQTVKFAEQGFFNVSAQVEMHESELSGENVFECVLSIPGTEYRVAEHITYYAGSPLNHVISVQLVVACLTVLKML